MSGPVLPEELLVEILSWVPVKDLMRFRCVSKSWNSLVFNPTFVKLHLQRSSKSTHILLTFDAYDEYGECTHCVAPCSMQGLLENPLSTLDDCNPCHHDYSVSVMGVCNGLVCLCNSFYGDDFKEFWFVFWNPATRIVSQDSPRIRLPPSPYLYRIGFGYDCWNDSYQVVALDNKQARVHCLGDTCWRNILTCPSFPTLTLHGVSVSGTLNWLALPNLESIYQWENVTVNALVIFTYDLKNETYSYLSMPHGLSEVPPAVPTLEVLNGCLCLSHHDRRNNFVVWLMREFGVENSWTQLLNISYEQLRIHDYIIPVLPLVLCMPESDDIMLLANYDCAEFILYNKRDNRIERRDHFKDGDDFNYGHFLSYDFVQSLVLPYQN